MSADLEKWRALASQELRGQPADELVWRSPEGIEIKPRWGQA